MSGKKSKGKKSKGKKSEGKKSTTEKSAKKQSKKTKKQKSEEKVSAEKCPTLCSILFFFGTHIGFCAGQQARQNLQERREKGRKEEKWKGWEEGVKSQRYETGEYKGAEVLGVI